MFSVLSRMRAACAAMPLADAAIVFIISFMTAVLSAG